MYNPIEKIESILERISEIIWWNRGLTKLNKIQYFRNFKEFIQNKLIEIKGPYLEFVLPPKNYDLNTNEFLKNLNFDEKVINAIINVLFNGRNLPLYYHQAEAIEAITGEEKDVIISVPTATGKTEAFFIPILDYCMKCNKKGLKALIIYPMKTLEIDQLNRFIKYLYSLNNCLENRESITIGVWDGDTPSDVGDPTYDNNAIKEDSFYRGVECPLCNKKLRIGGTGVLYCEEHDYFSWIIITRKNIMNTNVDILITNPESLDFLIISPEDEKKRVLGEIPSQYPVKYIVFDEIHIWNGIGGAALKLFIDRLLMFYSKNNPQLILLSATIKEPENLINFFSKNKNYKSITFKPYLVKSNAPFDFKRLTPCTFDELIHFYYFICIFGIQSRAELENKFQNYYNILNMLNNLGLVELDDDNNKIIKNFSRRLFLRNLIKSRDELEINTLFNNFIERLTENYEFKQLWRDLIIEKLPEVIHLVNLAVEDANNVAINFVSFEDLIKKINYNSSEIKKSQEIISMLLNFGRIAELLTDRYHLFLKPRENIYWCKKCLLLTDKEICECGRETSILNFCPNCHEIFERPLSFNHNINENLELIFENPEKIKKCPSCGSSIRRFHDLGVPYNTFISFLVSSVCRRINSKKILIFSDGRASAEKIGRNIIEYDYTLVAERLLLKLLLQSGGSKTTSQIFSEMLKEISELYYNFYFDKSLDDISKEIIGRFNTQYIYPLANISNMNRSFQSALITASCIINQLDNNIDFILSHEILKIFTSEFRNIRFSRNGVKFLFNNKHSITIDKILKRLNKKFKNLQVNGLFRNRVFNIFKLFLENKIISEISHQELNQLLLNQRNLVGQNNIDQIEDYLRNERDLF
ncbi:MAG: DEAD/DEAH box helicase, partial [Promethearchaeota archaeon]